MVKNQMRKNESVKESNRKGDISIQMLIWAALGLIVLIIIIGVLIGKIKFFNANTPDNCPDRCYSEQDLEDYGGSCPEGRVKLITTSCDKGQVCCKKLG